MLGPYASGLLVTPSWGTFQDKILATKFYTPFLTNNYSVVSPNLEHSRAQKTFHRQLYRCTLCIYLFFENFTFHIDSLLIQNLRPKVDSCLFNKVTRGTLGTIMQ